MADADSKHSEAAQQADATENVTRNTKSETTAASYTTTDHEVIRAWGEARSGRPATVADTEDSSGGGVLRIEFDADVDRLAGSDWDTFFRVFDERGLGFRYQERNSHAEVSTFNKLVRADQD